MPKSRVVLVNRPFEKMESVCLLDRAGEISISQNPVLREVRLNVTNFLRFVRGTAHGLGVSVKCHVRSSQ